jgi:hypothetical protein
MTSAVTATALTIDRVDCDRSRQRLNAVGAGKTGARVSIFKCMRSTFQLMDLSCPQHKYFRPNAYRDRSTAEDPRMMRKHLITHL